MYPKYFFPIAHSLVSLYKLTNHKHLQGSIRFLVYHSVMPHAENKWIPVSNIWLEDFEDQLKFIAESGFKVISMPEALQLINAKKKVNERMICFTFDDGFRNNYTIAWPVLRKYGFSAHFAITAESIDRDKPYPWDTWFKGDKTSSNPNIVDDNLLPLSTSDIRKLIHEGATIASHGLSHRPLSRLNEHELAREIEESKKILQDVAGTDITSFVYPFGNFDDRVVDRVRKIYDWAFSVKLGRINPTKIFNPHKLYRTSTLNRLTINQFKNILFGGLDFIRFKDKIIG